MTSECSIGASDPSQIWLVTEAWLVVMIGAAASIARAVCSLPAATHRNSTCTDTHALAYGPFMRMIETPHAPPTIKLSPSHRP